MVVKEKSLKTQMLKVVVVISAHLAVIAIAKFSVTNAIGRHEMKTFKNKVNQHRQVIGICK
jgi:hypothetical protein